MSEQTPNFKTGQLLFAGSITIPRTVKIPIRFTTAVINRDFLLELGLQMVRLEINNRDATNQVNIQLEPFATPEIIPPSSRGELTDEIHSGIIITPDAVTGTGEAFAFCAPTEELVRLGLIAS